MQQMDKRMGAEEADKRTEGTQGAEAWHPHEGSWA